MRFTLLSLLLAAISLVVIYLQIKNIPISAEQRRKLLFRMGFVLWVVGIFVVLPLLIKQEIEFQGNLPRPAPAPMPGDNSLGIPAFEFPPPRASASADIDLKPFMFVRPGTQRLGNIASRLSFALYESGYTELSWFSVPNGFALVTRLEQFNKDGTPTYGEYRWVDDEIAPAEINSISDYLYALFNAKPGRYRVFVFMVTNLQYSQSEKVPPTQDEAERWLRRGLQNGLPPGIASMKLTPDYTCKALIYEFVRPQEEDSQPAFVESSDLTGLQHLQKSKVWGALSSFKGEHTQ